MLRRPALSLPTSPSRLALASPSIARTAAAAFSITSSSLTPPPLSCGKGGTGEEEAGLAPVSVAGDADDVLLDGLAQGPRLTGRPCPPVPPLFSSEREGKVRTGLPRLDEPVELALGAFREGVSVDGGRHAPRVLGVPGLEPGGGGGWRGTLK